MEKFQEVLDCTQGYKLDRMTLHYHFHEKEGNKQCLLTNLPNVLCRVKQS